MHVFDPVLLHTAFATATATATSLRDRFVGDSGVAVAVCKWDLSGTLTSSVNMSLLDTNQRRQCILSQSQYKTAV